MSINPIYSYPQKFFGNKLLWVTISPSITRRCQRLCLCASPKDFLVGDNYQIEHKIIPTEMFKYMRECYFTY